MRTRKVGPERLGAFSDGVIAIIITIMVLDLRAPHDASLMALFALWPTFAAYALSYLFVAVVWVNHHHLLRYAGACERGCDLDEHGVSVFCFADSVFALRTWRRTG